MLTPLDPTIVVVKYWSILDAEAQFPGVESFQEGWVKSPAFAGPSLRRTKACYGSLVRRPSMKVLDADLPCG